MKAIRLVLSALLAILFTSGCSQEEQQDILSRLDTLEKVTIASIQGQLATINSTIGSLQGTQTQLAGYVTSLQTTVGGLQGDYSSLQALVNSLKDKDDSFAGELKSLKNYIDQCDGDVKAWVEKSYTSLEKFNTLQETVSGINTSITTINGRLDALDSSTQKIAADLKEKTDTLTNRLSKSQVEIEGIKKDLKALQDEMDSVKAQIAAIVSSVQSVVVVPDYSDGSVKLSKAADNEIRFELYPLAAAESIAKTGPSILSLDYVETQTKSSEDFVNLPITEVAFTGKTVLVTVDGTGLPDTIIEGTKTASARLRISDGAVTRSSEYFPIYRQEAGSQQSDIAVTGEAEHISAVSAVLAGKANLGSTVASDLKVGFQYSTSAGILPSNSTTIEATDADASYNYTTPITGLEPDTKYYFRSFVRQNGQDTYGETKEFTTKDVASLLETRDASGIEATKASLNAKLDLTDVKYSSKTYGFYWGTSENSQNNSLSGNEIEDNAYSASLTSLSPKTQYWYKAYVKLDSQTFYGEVKTFTTAQGVTSITLDKTSLSLVIGDEATLSVTSVQPDNANDKSVTWSSSDAAIASVDNSGKVIAKAKGKVSIRATANDGSGVNAACSLIVSSKCPTGAVDMGITTTEGYKLYWATCNIGASKPEDYGDYYAWGETTTKTLSYIWERYKFGTSNSGPFSKYNTISIYGPVDNKTVLDPEDDVAHVKLGGNWRMPTDEEWAELINNCTWTWTSDYNGTGVKGRIVTGPNDNSIFLPAYGIRGEFAPDVGSSGAYWSSSLDTDYPYEAWSVYFSSANVYRRHDRSRYYGQSVRPVTE
jgi:peptidoglycan hydrolase CwlO-like protein